MKYQIIGKNIEVTEGISSAIKRKVAKMDKYFENPDMVECRAVVRSYKNEAKVEITLRNNDIIFRAEVKDADLYAAIDLVIDVLERQIRKNKTRLKAKYKKEVLPDFIFDFEVTEEENEDKIVKRKKIDVKPMDEEEAILQMELLGHDFYVFNNIDEECISVLYRRKDGNYGIINTK